MTDYLHLELVTPEKRFFSENVYMVVVPGELGDFGVMAHHAPMISMLRPGSIEVHVSETKISKYFVGGGYANVSGNTCTVLAESLIPVEALERPVITQELLQLREALAMADSDVKRASLERQLMEAETKLLLVG
jgi:F-type H+-transporting ATPase subunit epsilon